MQRGTSGDIVQNTNNCLPLRTLVRYGVRMSLAQTFSELAEQLDDAVAAIETQSLSADEAARLLPLSVSYTHLTLPTIYSV